jgi:uncharacterized membrane protein YbhN (UPF0104 family)
MTDPDAAPASPARSRRLLLALGRLLVVALLIYAARRVHLADVLSALTGLRARWLCLGAACSIAVLPLWALEWWLLLPSTDARVPLRRMLPIVAMTSSVLNTSPLLLGEAAGVMFLVLRAGLSRTAAVSVLAMDQLFVGVAKVAVVVGAALVLPLPLWLARALPPLVAAVAALLLGLLALATRAQSAASWLGPALPAPIARRLPGLGAGLAPLRSPSRTGLLLVLALAKKGLELAAILCVQRAFGLTLPAAGLLALAALSVATLLPLMPAGIGLYEAAVVLAYTQRGVGAERALAIAVVQHALVFVSLALPGYYWILRPSRGHATRPAAA